MTNTMNCACNPPTFFLQCLTDLVFIHLCQVYLNLPKSSVSLD